ncbi:aminopeptidase [Ephemerocybe angulata]|uniref:Peptide hydrolase n=1 Tax=Ephemerocybe angulata TaxID=980116 RepID=A0A8H6MDK4_9AGAR|nr:aminopeptidase [Tulosesus angulatus]
MALSFRKLLLGFIATALVACRAAPLTQTEVVDKAAQGLRLIETEPGVEPVWMTHAQKIDLLKANKNFFDVTETYEPPSADSTAKLSLARPRPNPGQAAPVNVTGYAAPSRQAAVNPLISKISLDSMQSFLTNLTSFHNRYFNSTTGVDASLWIKDTLTQITKANPQSSASVSLFPHAAFRQPSIIAKIPGRNPGGPLTILGAHMDSINLDDVEGRAPGADDDGSGSVNLMEAYRVLVSSGFQPETPVEFQWYAGEEEGLLGSQDIAKAYAKRGEKVKAMLMMDMTAFVKPGTKEVISLMPDFTNENLTTFVAQLIDTYSLLDSEINNPCGYACSDHASWDKYGFPTALPFEATYPDNANEIVHTDGDTVDIEGFSWTHTLEYTKIALAFAFELGSA